MKIYRKLHRWHQTLGVAMAFFVILLVVTGVLLNHTEDLKLDHKYVASNLLLDWYNISVPDEMVSFSTPNHRVALLGNRLYFDEKEFEANVAGLLGVVEIGDTTVVAIPGQLLILDSEGGIIEKLGGVDGVPAGMKRLGLAAERQLVIEAAHGIYLADLEALEWQEGELDGIRWSTPVSLPEEPREALLRQYRGKGLTLERVLLDIHSGRLLGSFGVFLIDVAALLFLTLAITGVWMWSRRR